MSTLTDQLACLRRELGVRQRVYPGWIKRGQLSQEEADKGIADMQGAIHTVERALRLAQVSAEIIGRPTIQIEV